ncbi:MAG: tRNA pseudouridine(55) synthase TruB [Clostridiales bacterium]|jgi:tRNA pseudouridine55 synthase|nr:tRNA pseudouridine(55) synthase TruB [Clostridiales bacterium]
MQSDINGVLNIYKEKGYTSHDVTALIRKTLGRVKAGHAGTLDPQAVGVLPVCVGAATKIADYIGDDKRYRAELILGLSTDTEDSGGQVLERCEVNWNETDIEQAIHGFEGDIQQTPPMYSAVKVHGRKLYELARAGQTVERKARCVRVGKIKILERRPVTHSLLIDVTCSKGTYIRTLCADIGRQLGCGGCMGELTRLRSGPFLLEESVTISRVQEIAAENRLADVLRKIETVLPFPQIFMPETQEKVIRSGHPVRQEYAASGAPIDGVSAPGEKALLMLGGEAAGIYTLTEDSGRMWYKPVVLFIGAR